MDYFDYKNGKLFAENTEVENIIEKIKRIIKTNYYLIAFPSVTSMAGPIAPVATPDDENRGRAFMGIWGCIFTVKVKQRV